MARETRYTSYKRMSPAELRAVGFSPKARRYIHKRTGETISARQYSQKQLRQVFNFKGSLEKATKARKAGQLKYKSNEVRDMIEYRKAANAMRDMIPEITPSDIRLVLKFRRVTYKGLDDEEKEQFRNLFARYPREDVIDLLSGPAFWKS